MKRLAKKENRPKNPDVELSGIRSQLMFGHAMASSSTFRFKNNTDYKWMLKNFDSLYKIPSFKKASIQIPFPRSPKEILSTPPLKVPCGYLTEIYWAIAICSQFSKQITEFVRLKYILESSVLLGRHAQVGEALDKIKEDFGFSIWYIQNHLLHIQDKLGLDDKKKVAHDYFSSLSSIPAALILFMGLRSEGNSLKNGLKEDTEKFLSVHANNPSFTSYFRSKVTDLPYISVSEISGILFYEAASSVIDLYESLISILQEIASDNAAPENIRNSLIGAVKILFDKIDDPRIANVLRGLGYSVAIDDSEFSSSRGNLLDKYTKNEYEEFSKDAILYLDLVPNDMAVISLLAKASGRLGNWVSSGSDLVEVLIDDIRKVWLNTDESFFAAYSLMSLAEKYYCQSWALQLKVLVHDMLAEPEKDFPNRAERRLYIHSVNVSPFSALAFRGNAQKVFLENIEHAKFAPETTCVVNEILNISKEINLFVDQRLNKYRGRILFSIGKFSEANIIFKNLYEFSERQTRIEIAFYLAMSYLAIGENYEALKVTVDVYIKNPSVISKVSFKDLCLALNDPKNWIGSVYEPIFFEMYSSYFSKDKDAHLRYCFEFFQEKNKFNSPAEIVAKKDELGSDVIIQYLSKVCTPDVMRQSLLYNGTKEVEDERIRICRVLSDLDENRSSIYLDEVRERVKVQEISSGLEIVEQSLVYVDINAITKSLKSRLKDSYSKYRVLATLRKDSNKEFNDIVHALKEATPSLKNLVFLPLEKDESGSVFEVMFREVTNEFLKSDHGLNAFLSTRIRHGKLRNLLRKSVEEEFLVTARRPNAGGYIRNDYWKTRLKSLSPNTIEKILDCFDIFSRSFDDKITYILDILLRVEVINSSEVNANPSAWFIYRSSLLEVAVMRADENPEASLDDFIDRCIELLWQKTDANLAEVKRALTGYLKDDFLNIFDTFSKSILDLSHGGGVQLIDAIARARNNAQLKINTAANWFNRSVVYDRRDYRIEIAVNIAIAIINNIRSGISGDFGDYVKINLNSDSLMVGRTLDGLVDLFGILLENAIDHCKLDINSLDVEMTLGLVEGKLRIVMCNNISPDLIDAVAKESIIAIKQDLGKDGSRQFLQNEGRSGFHKIWKILSGPVYRKSTLDFKYTDDQRFLVEIEATLDT